MIPQNNDELNFLDGSLDEDASKNAYKTKAMELENANNILIDQLNFLQNSLYSSKNEGELLKNELYKITNSTNYFSYPKNSFCSNIDSKARKTNQSSIEINRSRLLTNSFWNQNYNSCFWKKRNKSLAPNSSQNTLKVNNANEKITPLEKNDAETNKYKIKEDKNQLIKENAEKEIVLHENSYLRIQIGTLMSKFTKIMDHLILKMQDSGFRMCIIDKSMMKDLTIICYEAKNEFALISQEFSEKVKKPHNMSLLKTKKKSDDEISPFFQGIDLNVSSCPKLDHVNQRSERNSASQNKISIWQYKNENKRKREEKVNILGGNKNINPDGKSEKGKVDEKPSKKLNDIIHKYSDNRFSQDKFPNNLLTKKMQNNEEKLPKRECQKDISDSRSKSIFNDKDIYFRKLKNEIIKQKEEMKSVISQHKEEQDYLQNTIVKLEKSLLLKENEIKKLKSLIRREESIDENYETLKIEWVGKFENLRNNMNCKFAKLENIFLEKEEKLNNLKENIDRLIQSRISSGQENYKKDLDTMKKNLKLSSQNLDNYIKAYEKLESSLKILVSENSIKDMNLKRVESDCRILAEEINKERTEHINKMQLTENKHKDEVERIKISLSSIKNEYKEEIKKLTKQYNILKMKYNKKCNEIQIIPLKSKEKRNETVKDSEEITNKNSFITEMPRMVSKLKASHKALNGRPISTEGEFTQKSPSQELIRGPEFSKKLIMQDNQRLDSPLKKIINLRNQNENSQHNQNKINIKINSDLNLQNEIIQTSFREEKGKIMTDFCNYSQIELLDVHKMKGLEKKNSELIKEISILQNSLSMKEGQISNLEKVNLVEIEKLNKKFESDIKNKEDQISKLNRDVSLFNNVQERNSNRIQELQSKLETSINSFKEKEKENKKLIFEIRGYSSEKELLKTKLSEFEILNTKLKNEFNMILDYLKDLGLFFKNIEELNIEQVIETFNNDLMTKINQKITPDENNLQEGIPNIIHNICEDLNNHLNKDLIDFKKFQETNEMINNLKEENNNLLVKIEGFNGIIIHNNELIKKLDYLNNQIIQFNLKIQEQESVISKQNESISIFESTKMIEKENLLNKDANHLSKIHELNENISKFQSKADSLEETVKNSEELLKKLDIELKEKNKINNILVHENEQKEIIYKELKTQCEALKHIN